MPKSSSSHRNKRDKISSKARTKKRSKSKVKGKSEKYRSKKVRRRHDSLSFSDDDDDSRSLSSDSSFSSEDDRRSRRARSRTRRDVKGGKKRGRKRSYSSDSSEESPRPRVKRRKGSKKVKEYEKKKRSRSREKPRRKARTSSVSSESWSCSTCQGGAGISGDEIESKRHRGRAEKRMREETDKNKGGSGTERSRYRCRSRSLRSHCSESDRQSQERVSGEGNGRRLRSVIPITQEDNEGRWLDVDGHKEEITHDHDDYPSCKSNDSNDGGSKRELDSHLHVQSEVKLRVRSAKEEEALVSNAQIMHLPSSGNIYDREGTGQAEGVNFSRDGSHGTRTTDHANENKICGEISSLKDDDLETILRQKALENLKRFRGKPQRIAVTGNKEDENQPSDAEAELVQIESPKARVVVVESSKEDVSENDQTRLGEETNVIRDSICLSEISEKETVKNNGRKETVSAKQDGDCPTHHEAVAGSSKMVSTTATVDKRNLAAPKSISSSIKPNSLLKRALASLESSRERLSVTESSVDNTASGTAQTVTQSSSNNDGLDINNGPGSTAPELTGEIRSDIQQDEAKDGSQFEQKTMSVKRGSEMVQVSYKVYIPKKAPALARRQLKR